MNKGSTNEASNKIKVVGGPVIAKENGIEIPPKKAYEKYINEINENFVEIVVHQNTRELLRKLEASKEEHTI